MLMPSSAPGWAMLISATITIPTQVQTIIDPSGFVKEFKVESPQAARLIAYLLIVLNVYDAIAAFQNNIWILWAGLAGRLGALAVFYFLGGPWLGLAKIEAIYSALTGITFFFL